MSFSYKFFLLVVFPLTVSLMTYGVLKVTGAKQKVFTEGHWVQEIKTTKESTMEKEQKQKVVLTAFVEGAEETKIPRTCLKLEQMNDGVVIRVSDLNGEPVKGGNLLAITDEGELKLFPNVNPAFGFVLDEDGRIKLGSDVR